jgi:CarD family transcriptional regulator
MPVQSKSGAKKSAAAQPKAKAAASASTKASRKPAVKPAKVAAKPAAKAAPAKPAAKPAAKAPAKAAPASVQAKAVVAAPLKETPKPAPAPAASVPSIAVEASPVPVVEAPVVPAAPAIEPPTFNVGDNAVYPGHGVGVVRAIEAKEIFGKKHEFYSIQILENGMKIMIPKDNVLSVGLRPIISRDEAAKVISILRETNVKIDNQTWNRRYREYMEKIKTGSVFEIAEVLRDLFLLKVDKELSFGERKMLDTARGLLLKELSLATSREELQGQDEVAAIFGLQGT